MILGKRDDLRISYPELRGSLAAMKYPALVEIKYDGELNTWNGKFLINKYGKTRYDFPAVNNLPATCTLIGELYYSDGKAGRLYDLLRHKEDDTLNFKVFDIIRSDIDALLPSKEYLLPLVTRREHLYQYIPKESIIQCDIATDEAQALRIAHAYIALGYEGAVVKSLDSPYVTGPCSWAKIKNKDQNDYVITAIDPTKERIEIDVITPNASPTLRLIEKHTVVGCKCPNKYKPTLRVGDTVTIEHLGILPSGSLRNPVFIGKVSS